MNETFSLNAVANALEQKIRDNRLMSAPVSWQHDLIYPLYRDLSFMNLAQSLAVLTGVPAAAPLDPVVWSDVPRERIRRVVLFISDGLGYLRLKRLTAADSDLRAAVAHFTRGRGFVPITSVAPSTTACALPTLWTAEPPAVHGMAGTFLYLPEFAMLGNMLEFSPVGGTHPPLTFARWGRQPETFIPVPSIAQTLAAHGVPLHSVLPQILENSGLSQLLHRAVINHLHLGGSDAWERLTEVLTTTRGTNACIFMYWPYVDAFSHMHGAEHPSILNEIKAEFAALNAVLDSEQVQDGQTLVLMSADHGHHDAPNVADIAPLADALRLGVGGDERFAYLYLREGEKTRVSAALEKDYADKVAWFDAEAALQAGLFGNGTPHPEFLQRVGDLILVPRLTYRLTNGAPPMPAISIHAGMSDEEMMVPLLYREI